MNSLLLFLVSMIIAAACCRTLGHVIFIFASTYNFPQENDTFLSTFQGYKAFMVSATISPFWYVYDDHPNQMILLKGTATNELPKAQLNPNKRWQILWRGDITEKRGAKGQKTFN